jgi:hypothetical protein
MFPWPATKMVVWKPSDIPHLLIWLRLKDVQNLHPFWIERGAHSPLERLLKDQAVFVNSTIVPIQAADCLVVGRFDLQAMSESCASIIR